MNPSIERASSLRQQLPERRGKKAPLHSVLGCMHRGMILGGILALPALADAEIRYGRDIRPILSDKCFFCHGPDPKTREEDLGLDLREEAIAGKAFVPGDAAKSRLIKRIHDTDEDDVMPPPESHKSLTAAEKKLLHDWIEAGAEYEPHWAYVALRREAGQNIDTLVARDLAKRGLDFSPPADPATLLRRLHFDVLGLPPSPEQVAAFQQAHARDPEAAVREVVEQLLASPHFGQRMAVSWLDAVRYADTVGYHRDRERSASPYRDYVIDAFNTDKPFDQFTIEQIAGDLLPNATLSQKVAASYNRLNAISEEGGIQDAEYLAKYQAERVRTTSAAWLGSTMACCECHDHKFDPFTAKDFYSFAAYFSDILEKGARNNDGKYQEDTAKWVAQGIPFDEWGPRLHAPTPEQQVRLDEIDAGIARLRPQLEATATADPRELDEWIAGQKALLTAKDSYDAPLIDQTLPGTAAINRPVQVDRTSAPVQSGSHSRKQEAAGLHFPPREYQADTGPQLYRRGLYTHWQRTFLHPMLKAFDAPAREEGTAERSASNTPLQALNLLNDPAFTEAARALAARLLLESEGGTNLVARAWLRCLSRPPTAEEIAILTGFHEQELERFTASPADAAALLKVGQTPAPAEIPPAKLATATSLARAILNLHETITRY